MAKLVEPTPPQAPPPAVTATPSVTMTQTSDMMQNYLPGELVSPTGKFEAVQTAEGLSMLFAITASSPLQVILEQTGVKGTGWTPVDLSSSTVASVFPGDTSAVVRTFDVNQSAVDGTIGIAMVVSSQGSDHLLLSLYNSNSDLSWTLKPTWKSVPFDASSTAGTSTVSIVGTMFAETENNHQYIIVDIDRASTNTVKDIVRYYVNPRSSSTCWIEHDVPVDIQAGAYQSCVGRVPNGFVDGVYTSGTAGTSAQLVYVPIYNYLGDGPPATHRLSLPGSIQATAIATARDHDYSTDLYAVGGSTLYRFAADAQGDESVATPLITNSVLLGTASLSAMVHDGVTTIWGKNSSNQVYYLACPVDKLADAASWSVPLPILSDVEVISPYVNCNGGGNTIFAAGGNTLRRMVQATETEAKLWRPEGIVVKALPPAKALAFNSYTTTIQSNDEQGQPAGNVDITLTTAARTPVYINGYYYVLSPTPISVKTDTTGTLTVIEAIHNSINGTKLTVSCDGGASNTTIDPTHKHFQSIANLNTPESLTQAQISQNVIAGGTQGPAKSIPLVAASTSSDDVASAANSISQLSTVYGSVSSPGSKPSSNSNSNSSTAADPSVDSSSAPTSTLEGQGLMCLSLGGILGGIVHHIEVAAGDLFHYLKSGVEHAIQIVKDVASGIWHFVATVAGKAYRAVLSTVEAVVGAVEWVFNAIKTVIEDIIRFLEFLLEWDDIKRTKEVICHMTKKCFQGQIDLIPATQKTFDTQISNVEGMIDQWAGVTDWSTRIGEAASKPASSSTSNPTAGQTSGSQTLVNHYKTHKSDLTVTGAPPTEDPVQQLFNDLLTALKNEEKVLSNGYSQLKSLATNFSSMSVDQVLKELVAIFADDLLSSVRVVGDAVLGVLTSLASTAMGVLETKIHIPVISDILSALGIPELSFLDLLCWIPAVAYTVIHKIATGDAPFPDNNDIQSILNAQNWDSLQALISQKPLSTPQPKSTVLVGVSFDAVASVAPLPISSATAKNMYVAMHGIGSLLNILAAFVSSLEAVGPPASSENPWRTPSTIISGIAATLNTVANIVMPRDPIQQDFVRDMYDANGVVTILAKIIFSNSYQKPLQIASPNGLITCNDGRATGAIVNIVLGIQSAFCSVEHFYELGHEAANEDRTAAIMNEVSNLANLVARVSYCVAVNDSVVPARDVPILVMVIAKFTQAGLQGMLCVTA